MSKKNQTINPAATPQSSNNTTRRRKPKVTGENSPSYYWPKQLDTIIPQYNLETDDDIRNAMFLNHLYRPLKKLTESLINTFKFQYIDVEFEEVQSAVIAFIICNLHRYSPNKGRSFSYFSVIAKNYLILLNTKGYNEEKRLVSFSDLKPDSELQHSQYIEDDTTSISSTTLPEFTVSANESNTDLAEFIDLIVKYWDENCDVIFKKKRDVDIASAVIHLFRQINKLENFNRKALYIMIRDITGHETIYITRVIKEMKRIITKQRKQYAFSGTV